MQVRVYTLLDVRSLPWHDLMQSDVDFRAVDRRALSGDVPGFERGKVDTIIDLSDETDIPYVGDVIEANPDSRIICPFETYHRLAAAQRRQSRVVAFSRFFFDPGVLELRRRLFMGAVGMPMRISIVCDIPCDELNAHLVEGIAAFFFASVGDDQQYCRVEVQPGSRIEIRAEGTDGTLIAVEHENYLRCRKTGDDQFVPLPEGDGSYYFMKELLRAVRNGTSVRFLSTATVRTMRVGEKQLRGKIYGVGSE